MALDPRRAHLADPRRAAAVVSTSPPPAAPATQSPITHATGFQNGPPSGVSTPIPQVEASDYKLKFCTVCASNQNRSMEAHQRLALASYPCISFGTGSLVRLPGPTINQPNVYPFNKTPYSQMYDELAKKDPRLYTANGLLNMLERNRSVKWGPERWQDWQMGTPRLESKLRGDQGAAGIEAGLIDIVITCEERCWDAVVDDLISRGGGLNRPVHVINVDIKDNHEEALTGGKAILDLADSLNAVARHERSLDGQSRGDFDERVPDVLAAWQERWPQMPSQWSLCWF